MTGFSHPLAVCKGTPIEWWFPEDELGRALDYVVPEEAARLCARCPVRKACDDHALRHEPHGVFAGMDENRRRVRRRNARIRLRTDTTDAIAVERAAAAAAQLAAEAAAFADLAAEDDSDWRTA